MCLVLGIMRQDCLRSALKFLGALIRRVTLLMFVDGLIADCMAQKTTTILTAFSYNPGNLPKLPIKSSFCPSLGNSTLTQYIVLVVVTHTYIFSVQCSDVNFLVAPVSQRVLNRR